MDLRILGHLLTHTFHISNIRTNIDSIPYLWVRIWLLQVHPLLGCWDTGTCHAPKDLIPMVRGFYWPIPILIAGLTLGDQDTPWFSHLVAMAVCLFHSFQTYFLAVCGFKPEHLCIMLHHIFLRNIDSSLGTTKLSGKSSQVQTSISSEISQPCLITGYFHESPFFTNVSHVYQTWLV